MNCPCASAHMHFCPLSSMIFSSFWGDNFLVGLGRKYPSPTIYFLSSPSNQIYFKKVFLPIFSPKFFIYSISSPNKHTLSVVSKQAGLYSDFSAKVIKEIKIIINGKITVFDD